VARLVAIPAKLQNDIKQFQRLQQELGSIQQQRLQIDLRVRELGHTLDELKTLPEDSVVYRPIGGLLVRAKDRKEVEEILAEDKETLEVRLKAIERQENHLKERYTTMQQELTAALQAQGISPTGPAPTGASTD
jgi:prefoldin beta subunit